MKLKALTWIATAGIAIAALACSGDDDGSSGSGSGSGSSESTTSGSSNCASDWECVNGACQCTTSGKEGNSCCHPDDCTDSSNCDAACEVCN
jgi:hypothetical protein